MKRKTRFMALLVIFTLIIQLIPTNLIYAKAKGNEKQKTEKVNDFTSLYNYSLISTGDKTLDISGSESNISNNVLSNGTFNFFGSRLNIGASCITKNKITTAGAEINIKEKLEEYGEISIPSLDKDINKMLEDGFKTYDEDKLFNDEEKVDTSIKVNGNIKIDGKEFKGDKYIIASQDINLSSRNTSNNSEKGFVLYSEKGNINISSSNVNMNGLIYAPNGTVTITSANFNLNGLIIAKNIVYRGSRFNIKVFEGLKDLVPTEIKLELADKDKDGCPDFLEDKLGLNKDKADTDEDGLLDDFEALKLLNATDGTKKDTDNNGISDADEDTDKDGLKNIDEQRLVLDPLSPDTDNDGLLDGDEINKFGTNALKKDTDDDKLNDGEEKKLGTNPLNPDTNGNGILDGDEKYNQSFEDSQTGAKVDIVANGDISNDVRIKEVSEDSVVNKLDCLVSKPVDIQLDKEFEKATVSLEVDSSKLPNNDIENVQIFYFDEELMTMVPLEKQGIDKENNRVWGETDHFTTFVLFYVPNWYTLWQAPLNKGNRDEADLKYIDMMFTIDCSGSMSSSDSQGNRKEAAKRFVDGLIKGDRAGVVAFESYAQLLSPLTEDLEDVKKNIDRVWEWGGTNIGAGADMANNELIKNGRKDAVKAQILLTDGSGSYSSKTIKDAIENEIIIYTIGLGRYVDSARLKEMAESTGGMYFPVVNSEDLPDVFDRIQDETGKVVDTDEDGVPDNVEVEGIRDGLGNIYYTDPNNPDTDGDGRTDGQEVGDILSNKYNEYYYMDSDPTVADTDGDGLSDLDESELGTKSYDPDSDFDGLIDCDEVNMGYNPINRNSDNDSYDDKEEYEKELDPFFYDKVWYEHIKDVAAGALWGDAGNFAVSWGLMEDYTWNSLGYIGGHIASGLAAIGDIRDLIASVANGDVVSSILNLLGLVPAFGDAGKIASNLVEFGGRNVDNIPKMVTYITRELEDSPEVYKVVSESILPIACKNSEVLGDLKSFNKVDNDTLLELAKKANKLDVISDLSKRGLCKLSDEIFSAADKAIINNRVIKFWGENLSPKVLAEATATEGAILKYENEGYKLVYAQRKKLRNGVHGPDIIMQKGDDVLIIEAKGSYAEKAIMSDGKKKGTRLTAELKNDENKKILVSYLSREWLSIGADKRYMNSFEKLANQGLSEIHGLNYEEALNIMDNIIRNKGKYKASVVYGGVKNSNINWGSNISDYIEELLNENNASSIEMLKFDM